MRQSPDTLSTWWIRAAGQPFVVYYAVFRLGAWLMSESQRDVMEYEVAVVGAGPAGLACAIRLKQLSPDKTICVLEKAATVGAHSLSGAVLEPGPLEQLLPEFRTEYPGMKIPAGEDDFRVLTRQGSFKAFPDFLAK